IPTASGAVLFDPGYTSNPLVFCGCLGIAPVGSHPRTPLTGDRVIVIGGRTGRDGLRGATFSSMTMDAQTGEVSGASVQIGAPITEKGLVEVIVRARDERLYHAVTDCGAGGLSSAVGEMASETGAAISLDDVPLKYPGLAPWEIWLSEAQERMVLAVPPENLGRMKELCAIFDVELTDIGVFTDHHRLVITHQNRVVLDLQNAFLHDGIPQRQLKAVIPVKPAVEAAYDCSRGAYSDRDDYAEALLGLLSHPNIASKAEVIHLYDHEVLGGTLVKPLTGAQNDGPSDACVLRPPGSVGLKALALSTGINPEYGKLDAYRMAAAVIDEAVRNAVAVGANPRQVALLDNFCWGDPKRPETMGSLLEAARACYETALLFGAPFVSGKDSLNNEYLAADGLRHAIPPTLLISGLGMLEDYRQAVTMDLKRAGNRLYRVGYFDPRLGASHYRLWARPLSAYDAEVPPLRRETPAVYRALHAAMTCSLVRACHDLSEGGLGVAAAEMSLAGRLGVHLQIGAGELLCNLFGETTGCLLVEVEPENCPAFESGFDGLPLEAVGEVSADGWFVVNAEGRRVIDLPVDALVKAWNRSDKEVR
ncbi:MAG: phosphoribosylformylglycinamidine synthase subunit PurL, partial [Anaerolineae bacterium]|nr:phosphoribosylformylglycinamidine synthase subunit PurL [Anaerolineae bacterium]